MSDIDSRYPLILEGHFDRLSGSLFCFKAETISSL